MAELVLFAGPTLARARQLGALDLGGVTVLPPVRRGDVPARVAAGPPATLVIVDGLFHQALAGGHRELRDAMDAGFTVWGLGSMGAIRAREMRALGVRGFGRVFAEFCRDGVDFRDDEVTLLHEPGEPWRELSEPLVHLRAAVRHLVDAERLAASAASAIVAELEGMWFGDRTLPWLAQRLGDAGVTPEVVADTVRGFDRFRLKALDLRDFLATRPA